MNKDRLTQRLYWEIGWNDKEVAKGYQEFAEKDEVMKADQRRIMSVIAGVPENQYRFDFAQEQGEDAWQLTVEYAQHNLKGKTVLDIASGPGSIIEKNIVPAVGHLITVDKSGEMLKLLKKDEEMAPYQGKISAVKGDATHLPIKPGSVDVALGVHLVHYLKNESEEDKFLAEAMMTLKVGGYLLINGVANSANRKYGENYEKGRQEELRSFQLVGARIKEVHRDYVFLDSELEARLKKLGFEAEIVPYFNSPGKTHCAVKITKKSEIKNDEIKVN